MLTGTFCHIPGVGKRSEERIWDSGTRSWEDCIEAAGLLFAKKKAQAVSGHLYASQQALHDRDPKFFANTLPAGEIWRLFPEFRGRIAYLDIETTGLDTRYGAHITTIALYDGKEVRHYIHNENLMRFRDDIFEYDLLVTYNGKLFDIPFIENYFMIKLDQPHIDLRYVLHSLGYKGGLKGCEAQLGLDRGELEGVDGYFAVLLWREYERMRNPRALETLLAYNIQDTINLEHLLILAYNMKLRETPFIHSHQIALPDELPENPFVADVATIGKIKREVEIRYGQWPSRMMT